MESPQALGKSSWHFPFVLHNDLLWIHWSPHTYIIRVVNGLNHPVRGVTFLKIKTKTWSLFRGWENSWCNFISLLTHWFDRQVKLDDVPRIGYKNWQIIIEINITILIMMVVVYNFQINFSPCKKNNNFINMLIIFLANSILFRF